MRVLAFLVLNKICRYKKEVYLSPLLKVRLILAVLCRFSFSHCMPRPWSISCSLLGSAGAGDDAGYLQKIKQGRNSMLGQRDTLFPATALPAGGTQGLSREGLWYSSVYWMNTHPPNS